MCVVCLSNPCTAGFVHGDRCGCCFFVLGGCSLVLRAHVGAQRAQVLLQGVRDGPEEEWHAAVSDVQTTHRACVVQLLLSTCAWGLFSL